MFVSDAGRELSPPLQPAPVSSPGTCGQELTMAIANHLPPPAALFKKNNLSKGVFCPLIDAMLIPPAGTGCRPCAWAAGQSEGRGKGAAPPASPGACP